MTGNLRPAPAGGNEVGVRCSGLLGGDNPNQRQPITSASSGPFGSGSARLGLSQKDGLPNRWLAFICCGSRPSTRALSSEAAMNALRSPTLPQWKIDLLQAAIRILEGEKVRRITAAMIARR